MADTGAAAQWIANGTVSTTLFAALAFGFVGGSVRETKGRTLEEM